MNRTWMSEHLESYKALCEAYDQEERRSDKYTDAMGTLNSQMNVQIPTVKEIIKRLDPEGCAAPLDVLHSGSA